MKKQQGNILRNCGERPLYSAVILFAALLSICGCSRNTPDATESVGASNTMSHGPLVLTMTVEPHEIMLDRDSFLTIKTEAPPSIEVRLPDINDRLSGFILQGEFDSEPFEESGLITKKRNFRLTPTIADERRISPMAIVVTDHSTEPPKETWFATRPMTFQNTSIHRDAETTEMRDIIEPIRIIPSLKTLFSWGLISLIPLCAVFLLWLLIRKIKKSLKLRRMSPKDRALRELEQLLAMNLIAEKRIKDFYVELTMIVRRYIERAHKIRAPEQTTEEFLIAAAARPSFKKDVVSKLQDFLQNADLVKFAAFNPDAEEIEKALTSARDYIYTDEETSEREGADVQIC